MDWDVDSGARRPITSGTSSETSPALSPDGKKLRFLGTRQDYTLVTVSLENGTAERVLSSELPADMPAWALRRQKFAYVTSRNGSPEIWVRGEGDQPIVTPASFPARTTNRLVDPALSPVADRLIYTRLESNGHIFNWALRCPVGLPSA
jgi:Tol biopolymer transport system component